LDRHPHKQGVGVPPAGTQLIPQPLVIFSCFASGKKEADAGKKGLELCRQGAAMNEECGGKKKKKKLQVKRASLC